MATSLSSAEGDALRATVADYGAPPFNLDTVTATQIQTYATNNITSLATAATAWVTLAKVALWIYRYLRAVDKRLSTIEKRLQS